MRRISTLQPIHLYNLEPIICGSKKVPCSALLKFRTYLCLNEGVTSSLKSRKGLNFSSKLKTKKL